MQSYARQARGREPIAPAATGEKSRVSSSPNRSGSDLGTRLRARRQEIEQAAQTRVRAISEPQATEDRVYLDGLLAARSAAIGYALEGLQCGDHAAPPVPAALLVQARLAARAGVSLDTVLRRYFAGYTLFCDFLVEEAEAAFLDASQLKKSLRCQAALFDRVLAAVADEYAREEQTFAESVMQRRVGQVRRLLAGEPLDASGLRYDLDTFHHLGLVIVGTGVSEALHQLAGLLDRRLLIVTPGEGRTWAWFGGRQEFDIAEVHELLSSRCPTSMTMAVGEPAEGREGWRLTHHQAAAALPIACKSPGRPLRYRDVALLATILQDDLIATSLRNICLKPLETTRDGGQAFRQTLRAYFSANRNISSAAADLGVNRRTVSARLRAIEGRLGRTLSGPQVEMEAALALDELDGRATPKGAPGMPSTLDASIPLRKMRASRVPNLAHGHSEETA